MNRAYPLFFSLVIVMAQACSITDPEDIIPAYVQVDSIQFVDSVFANPDANITEVWTDVNGRSLGIFNLPSTVPVIAEGNTRLQLRAGIYADGTRELKVAYPFYEPYTVDVFLTPPSLYVVRPEVKYVSSLETDKNRTLIEDFEIGNPAYMVLSGDTANVTFEANNTGFLYPNGGAYSGLITIPAGNRKFFVEDVSFRQLDLMSETYLELTYKSDIGFQVGVTAANTTGGLFDLYDLNLRPTSTWRKVYVFLQDDLSNLRNATGGSNLTYKVGLRVVTQTTTTSHIAIDNVRLMHNKSN